MTARLKRLPVPLPLLLVLVLLVAGVATRTHSTPTRVASATAVPATPSGLPVAIEPSQPYIGQSTCDAVAKPGVQAFVGLLLRTYPDTGSLGIVRGCSLGEQSEHKEGRAWDWKASLANTRQHTEVSTLLGWLTATDSHGNRHAMARRLGIMYMIWNHQIWKAYDDRGWQTYTGPNPHTDHVHFSFGWSGAKKQTSYWTRAVAKTDYGPRPPALATPVRAPANLAVVRTWAGTALVIGGSPSKTAVGLAQRAVKVTADGSYGPGTAAAVQRFQTARGLPETGRVGRTEWTALFPPPIDPFGTVDVPSIAPHAALLSGWALDVGKDAPVTVRITLDGVVVSSNPATGSRPTVASAYPPATAAHGFRTSVALPDDATHTVCAIALNVSGTPGVSRTLACKAVAAVHIPRGKVSSATVANGLTTVSGWVLDPDTADPAEVTLSADGGTPTTVLADLGRADVGATYPEFGAQHGFAVPLQLTAGKHSVCATAKDTGGGQDAAVGCLSVTVTNNPEGAFESVRREPTGLRVLGLAVDPDSDTPLQVVPSVDGVAGSAVTASTDRPDMPTRYPGHDTAHGLNVLLPLPSEGTHRVCLLAPNDPATPGADASLGCHDITVSHNSVAAFYARPVPGGTVAVTGWAMDPDTTGPVHVQVTWDGQVVRSQDATLTAPAPAPGYGSAHGYAFTLRPLPGRHLACLVVSNAGGTPGAPTTSLCRIVPVATPTGAITSLQRSAAVVTVFGWTIDPDTRSAVRVTVRLDGRAIRAVTANGSRNELAATWPGYGTSHGYTISLVVPVGRHTVCITAGNVAGTPGGTGSLGCRTVAR